MGKAVSFLVTVTKDDKFYVAKCIENNVASQGFTIEEALNNLKEALELYYDDEDIPEVPLDKNTFITTVEINV